ncbi:MAG: PfkB family carbohydrate kinase [Anaerolineae bacterium]
MIDYLVIGHISADIAPGSRLLGGTVSYAARTAHAFGLRVGVLTSAAQDEPLLDELTAYAEIINLPSAQTTTFENIYEPAGRKQYVRAVGGRIGAKDVPEAWHSAPMIHFAPLTDEIDADIVAPFTSAHQRSMLTPQGWMRRWDADGRVHFKQWQDDAILSQMDIVVFSEEDIAEAPHLEQAFVQVAPRVVVTRAYHGGTYYVQAERYTYKAVETEAVDPTGAGDVFAASLFAAFYETDDFHSAVRFAATIAATSITRVGMEGTPTPDEVRAARQSNEDV